MNSAWMSVLAVAASGALVIGVTVWIATRPLLHGAYRTTPFSANLSGWRVVFKLIAASPGVALIGFAIKLLQILGGNLRALVLVDWPNIWVATGIALDLAFVLSWASFALQVQRFVLAPDISRRESTARSWRAVLYAFVFWMIAGAIYIVGVLLFAALQEGGRVIVAAGLTYLPYIPLLAAALTRPAIAVGLPRPFVECRRILRENWLGIMVSLALAAAPLGLVFFAVGLVRQTFHPALAWALPLEAPIAGLSALCYAAFESIIATTYRRIA